MSSHEKHLTEHYSRSSTWEQGSMPTDIGTATTPDALREINADEDITIMWTAVALATTALGYAIIRHKCKRKD